MLYRATHLTVRGSGAVYQSRGDLVNLCIGTQNYCDVVIENYDPSVTYTGLMGIPDFDESAALPYVSLSGKRAIDRTVTYTNGGSPSQTVRVQCEHSGGRRLRSYRCQSAVPSAECAAFKHRQYLPALLSLHRGWQRLLQFYYSRI